ncbi:hypothetical protein K458DRAFT_385854 [Lentithecium fluviatile CBS 122367]|uniref:Uncharacterized protein n=1 Tax=Lentithecium fluviatile CBS 122367 TaxID=1168545 RepID=A0A6G1J9Y4_9PLEO|nr:hypothetical protein K458DRAFT_385854 [Lentithecium fluviatile CBS 122367]
MATGDIFVDMLQGQIFEVVVGTKTPTFDPPVYYLPCGLFSTASGYFQDEIARQTSRGAPKDSHNTAPTSIATPDPSLGNDSILTSILKISLPDEDPGTFGLFLRFVYQGHTPFAPATAHPFGPGTQSFPQNNAWVNHAPNIPPSIRAWVLGSFLRAPAFQNHALQYTETSLGRTIFITPQLVHWVYTQRTSADALRRFVLDALVLYWSEPTAHVTKGVQYDELWMRVFNCFPDLHKAFIFGLQGRKTQRIQAQRYFVETPSKNTYISPYTTPPAHGPTTTSAAVAAAKLQVEKPGHMPNLRPYTKIGASTRSAPVKKKEQPQLVVKQETQTTPLSEMPFARTWSAWELKYGGSNSPAPTPTPTIDSAMAPTQSRLRTPFSTPNQQNIGNAPSISKRSASPTLAQQYPKLPKLLPKPADNHQPNVIAERLENKKADATTNKLDDAQLKVATPEGDKHERNDSATNTSEVDSKPKECGQ